MGQGLHSALSLTVAEALGIRPEQVFINPTDTATCPWDVGTHASRGAFIACNAALLAAEKVRARLFEAARRSSSRPRPARTSSATERRIPGTSLPTSTSQGAATADAASSCATGASACGTRPPEPWLAIELPRLLRSIHFRGKDGQMITESAFFEPNSELPDWKEGRGNMSASYAFGTQGAEVEVDVETGEVRILRMVSVHDVGQGPQSADARRADVRRPGPGHRLRALRGGP